MRKDIVKIENEIKRLFEDINNGIDEKYQISGTESVFFEESNPGKAPGTYIYVDSAGYHLDIVGDRGGVIEKVVVNKLEDLYFELCWTLCSTISTLYASENRIKGKDWRRIMFAKRVELLDNTNFDFAKRGKKRIDEMLENALYDDELLG